MAVRFDLDLDGPSVPHTPARVFRPCPADGGKIEPLVVIRQTARTGVR
jgi:hypothetical protein